MGPSKTLIGWMDDTSLITYPKYHYKTNLVFFSHMGYCPIDKINVCGLFKHLTNAHIVIGFNPRIYP